MNFFKFEEGSEAGAFLMGILMFLFYTCLGFCVLFWPLSWVPVALSNKMLEIPEWSGIRSKPAPELCGRKTLPITETLTNQPVQAYENTSEKVWLAYTSMRHQMLTQYQGSWFCFAMPLQSCLQSDRQIFGDHSKPQLQIWPKLQPTLDSGSFSYSASWTGCIQNHISHVHEFLQGLLCRTRFSQPHWARRALVTDSCKGKWLRWVAKTAPQGVCELAQPAAA